MGQSTLPDRIYSLPSFQREYRTLVKASVAAEIPGLDIENTITPSNIDWGNLLCCASILAQSDKSEALDAALRIAQHCLQADKQEQGYLNGAAVILEMLSNKPAINLAIQRHLLAVNYREDLPLILQLHSVNRDISNSIDASDGQLIYLNKFQREVYRSIIESARKFVSISAPTSAGKSFVLYQIILNILANKTRPTNLVYIVPTRALISQVEADLKQILKDNGLSNVSVYTVPQMQEENWQNNSNVLVFTQERLHWFLREHPGIVIDYLVVDEAHKIQDGSRGILLQQVIEDLLNAFSELKVYFSSPFTKNPERLLNGHYGDKNSEVIKIDYVTVNQNLLFVTPDPTNSKKWKVRLCYEKGIDTVGNIHLDNRPVSAGKKLLFIAEKFAANQGGVIIYANGAADAEEYALALYAIRENIKYKSTKGIKDLIKLVKKTVHAKYRLVTCLSRGIAFHYGNMPQLIRAEIERLFRVGELQFIVCTSTLLEGVNLPARTLVIRKPTRGRNQPMNSSDFWNLAGRAGRWGMEFQGNIVCIEPDSWENTPTPQNKGVEIKKAIDLTKDEQTALLDFIATETPRSVSVKEPKLEAALSYYYTAYINERLEIALQKNLDLLKDLSPIFRKLHLNLDVPDEIILKNPGISPFAMQNMYLKFISYEKNPENLIPMLPEVEGAAELSYIPLIRRICRYLSGDSELLAAPRAYLVVNWMQGTPLSMLISKNDAYWRKKGTKPIDTVIRDVMKEVEEYARFKFAKYSACYLDILRVAFRNKGQSDLIAKIPILNMWLEFGVSQGTQLSLISLGLSRSTAIAVSEYIRADNLSPADCYKWLKQNNLEILRLSPVMLAEIKAKVLSLKKVAI